MILRNPAAMWDSFFRVILSAVLFCLTGSLLSAQGVMGSVVEEFSRQPISQGEVQISIGDSVVYEGQTNENGQYTFASHLAGRIVINIKAQGFTDVELADVMLDGYATYQFTHLLEKKAFDLPGIVVVATENKPAPFALNITPDDIVLVAGNFDDPIRIAHSEPGIVLINDQANQLSARGQSPLFNTWNLEGLEIVNPNHTSNAGTFSDLPTQYGGGINMFSSQILGSTDIYLGLNPLNVGSSSGASVDMHLHESAKPEWRAKIGLIGFEFGGGTAIGSSGMLDFNLRYSFTGLLTGLGVDFGGEKIGFYDGVVSFTDTGLKHKLKLYAWGGKSTNEFDQAEQPEDIEEYKDFFNIDYSNDILGAGGKYDYALSPSLILRSGASFSTNRSLYTRFGRFDSTLVYNDFDDQISIFSSFLEFSFKFSDQVFSNAGIHYLNRSYPDGFYGFLPFFEESVARPYFNTTFRIHPALQVDAGGEVSYSFLYHTWDPGYRATLKWNYTSESSLFAGIRQGVGEALFLSAATMQNHFINHHYELGWNLQKKKNEFSLDLYFHQLNRLTRFQMSDGFIHLADYPNRFYNSSITGISHEATGRYYGVEGRWEYNNAHGWRFFINQSLYQSERGLSNADLEPGRYNGAYATHVSIAREIIKQKEGKSRIWNFSLRGLLHGGLWEESIDQLASAVSFDHTVYSNPGTFDQQLPVYKRIDVSISRTIAFEKVRWRYSFDIQNIFGFTNIAYNFYDPYLEKVVAQEQLGIIPVLSVQASW